MAAVSGPRIGRLSALLDEVNETLSPGVTPAVIALTNTPTRHVLAGDPAVLDMVRDHLTTVAEREAGDRRRGRHGGATLSFVWNDLPVEVPFHTPALAAPARSSRSGSDSPSCCPTQPCWRCPC